ncbi:Predicted arabinose efflux permease, MFS family [Lentzea xinjiangensis]|uniref:Predicted arabinose efflux permease, MFS family n=1 Tax=Lentzea xinjiangensis TaxID=402600 RepID=A0A1H9IVL7_9PSEU|nr:MFS transporter [Lentzea xinjiangensis]SEQ78614.1 Predicted arabinose efflux permease, MFS family [Lentzea xinjiangensis]
MGGSFAPLAHPAFRWLFGARVTTMAGNAMAQIALVFAVRDVTESVTTLGLVVAARSAANVLFLLWGGVVADRLPRQLVLVGSSAVSAASQALLAVLVLTGAVSIPAFVVLAVVNGMSSAFSLPASAALAPQTVPAEQRQRANALLRLGRNSSMIAGASLGGLLIAFAGPGWGLAVDALSFALAGLCFSFVRVAAAEVPAGHRPGALSELRAGWAEFVSRTWVWVVVVAFTFVNAAYAGGTMVLGPVLADTVMGRETWGFVLAAQTAGMVAGALVALRTRMRRPLLFGAVCVVAFAFLPLALALRPEPWLLMVAAFACGLCQEQFGVAWETSLQQHVPQDRLARVYSYDMLGSLVAVPLAQLAVGPVSGVAGITATLLGCAALPVLAAVAMVLSRSVRSVGNTPVVLSSR